MYSSLQLAIKYIFYWVTAANGKGHGAHSPFVFEFITEVLNDSRKYYCFGDIEKVREQLKHDDTEITLDDFGAGSKLHLSRKRKVSAIAQSSLKSKKFAQLLFRIVNFYLSGQSPERAVNILELGTSLGITTAYLASGNKNYRVTTMEGAGTVANIAKKNFQRLGLSNIEVIEGNFDHSLPRVANRLSAIDFAFIDGNHRREPTIRYFNEILKKITAQSILIFDDIHWSKEMEEAWEYVKDHPSVTLSVDLFFIGIVFFRKEQRIKQHFTIRF